MEKTLEAAGDAQMAKKASTEETASVVGSLAGGTLGYDLGRKLIKKIPTLGSVIGATVLGTAGYKAAKTLFKKDKKMEKNASIHHLEGIKRAAFLDELKKIAACSTPGKKMKSKGMGRGKAIGDGKGPLGIPYKEKKKKKEKK